MTKQRTNKLYFPSGRKRAVMLSRYELARRVASAKAGEWVKVDASEEESARSLAGWGMIERNAAQPIYVRWHLLHERPTFAPARRVWDQFGVAPVRGLSDAQYGILSQVATQRDGYAVLAKGAKDLQRTLRGLIRRGVLQAEIVGDAWRLTFAPAYLERVASERAQAKAASEAKRYVT